MTIFFSANIKGKRGYELPPCETSYESGTLLLLIEVYTKLGELKEAIDGESIVEIMKKFELIEEKEPAISEKWKKYSKSIKKEDLNKPVKFFRNMESGSFL